jgi:hypothetical protein
MLDGVLSDLPRITYQRLRERGFVPSGIIDVGACKGDSATLAKSIFPSALSS